MASQLSVSVKKRRKHLSAPVKKHRKDVANQFNCQRIKLDANLPQDEAFPCNGRVPRDKPERNRLIDMLLAEKGLFRASQEKKHREFLHSEINKINSDGRIVLHPIADFNRKFLHTAETHEFPVNWPCELNAGHVMGIVPKELLAALYSNFREGKDKCFNMIAKHGQHIKHAPAGTGWHKMLENKDVKKTDIKIDLQVRILSEAFKNLFVKAFLHNNQAVTQEELDEWNHLPGVVGTKLAGHQDAHIDINEKKEKEDLTDICILHTPLQEKGALLSLRNVSAANIQIPHDLRQKTFGVGMCQSLIIFLWNVFCLTIFLWNPSGMQPGDLTIQSLNCHRVGCCCASSNSTSAAAATIASAAIIAVEQQAKIVECPDDRLFSISRQHDAFCSFKETTPVSTPPLELAMPPSSTAFLAATILLCATNMEPAAAIVPPG